MDCDNENIPAPVSRSRDDFEFSKWLETYMKRVGRKRKAARAMIDRAEVPDRPEDIPSKYIQKKWKFLPRKIEGLPNASGVRWRAVVNNISGKWPYGHEVPNGNSYFSAVALVVYGSTDLWMVVRADHLAYFEAVIYDSDYPRHELYLEISSYLTGSNEFSLYERLNIPDCWVDHKFVQQVTADLYGMCFITFEKPYGTERISDVCVRGDFNAPHRFLLFANGTDYNPLVPIVENSAEYRFPEITLQGTIWKCNIAGDLDEAKNDGHHHPWRRLIEGTPCPNPLAVAPITVSGPIENVHLEAVLWVNIRAEAGEEFGRFEKREISMAKKILAKAAEKEAEEKKSRVEADGSGRGVKKQPTDNGESLSKLRRTRTKSGYLTPGPSPLSKVTNADSSSCFPPKTSSVLASGSLNAEELRLLINAAGPLTETSNTTTSSTDHQFVEADGIFTETIITTTTRVVTFVQATKALGKRKHDDTPNTPTKAPKSKRKRATA